MLNFTKNPFIGKKILYYNIVTSICIIHLYNEIFKNLIEDDLYFVFIYIQCISKDKSKSNMNRYIYLFKNLWNDFSIENKMKK